MQNFIGISRAVDSVRSNAGSALKTVQRTFEETALKAAGLGEEDEALYRLNKRAEAYLRAVEALQQARQALAEDFVDVLGDASSRDAARKLGDKSRAATAQQLSALGRDVTESARRACEVDDYSTRQLLVGKAFAGLLDADGECHRAMSSAVEKTREMARVSPSAPARPQAYLPPRSAANNFVVGSEAGVSTPPVARNTTMEANVSPPAVFDDLIGGMDGAATAKAPELSSAPTGDLLDFGGFDVSAGAAAGLGASSPPRTGPLGASSGDTSNLGSFDLGAAFGAAPAPTSTTQAPTPGDDNLTLGGLSWPSKEEEDESCIRARVEAWQEGKNLRTMLVSLHEVAPSSAGWVPVKLGEVVQPSDVKAVYRKAVLAVHPDKQPTDGARKLGHFVFESLREQWGVFRTQEKV